MKIILSALTLFLSLFLHGQDTLTVMHYNLLFYGENTDWCTSSNNNINLKDGYLRTIIDYAKPDIFTVNEISHSPSIHQHLLDQVLNTSVDYYEKANFISVADSDIANMLYYNSNKLKLYSHTIAQSFIRDIDVYTLYHLDEGLLSGDTAFVICVVSHLKAGTGTTNSNYRKTMAGNTMDYLADMGDEDNYLMMGDFNVYSDEEPAWLTFTEYDNISLQFNDPVNRSGSWNNNPVYSDVHTQSTHTSSNGCPSGGGMDDRFDFILISNDIKQGNRRVEYVPGSYWAIGQDGNHFNKSIVDPPTNTSVPGDVLGALYGNSDHLPVTLKLTIDKYLDIYENTQNEFGEISFVNPAQGNLDLKLKMNDNSNVSIELLNTSGQVRLKKVLLLTKGYNRIGIELDKLKPGLYFVRLTDSNKKSMVRKLIVP